MPKIIGVIYPVPKDIAERLFDGKAKVFVKFLSHNSTRLTPKNKVIFYASHGSKKLIGEGIVERVEFLTAEEVVAKYKDKLFLKKAEFQSYVRRSPVRTSSREMLTLVLRKLRKYPKPIEFTKPITMAGQYLSAEEYNSFIKTNTGEEIANS